MMFSFLAIENVQDAQMQRLGTCHGKSSRLTKHLGRLTHGQEIEGIAIEHALDE
jgi:hypothetical protein